MFEFQKFCWSLKRQLRKNRKPIVLFYGNGYESQLLLVALSKIGKKLIVVFVDVWKSPKDFRKLKNIAKLFSQHIWLVFSANSEEKNYKTFFALKNRFLMENGEVGFGYDYYTIITGHKISEPSLIQSFFRGKFTKLITPLLRYSDEWIETLYQDMKNTESNGSILYKNLVSDSHHNIHIV